ncbi:Bug family tripartite tricarboxylate transporter substrate binding protein [Actinophytocola gossypii]|uniref:Tripartite tricarboxylate transporter substrate binding protein n=1 Tax=Actinophytocola gossypii TaxID=2812003 RepID=A0ABT2J2G1_9PSEU|nr:tripartite tricarboxylate transporter substrate binding protein [Actinophytocola gossypii]MCT2582044.1 tripartite tricarboxylate transporter substrate binding protein [Actinophytocola gossypii]
MTITRGTKVCVASLVALATTLALTSGLGGRPPAEDNGIGDFAGQRIRFVVPTAAGGGFDTTLRQLQPYLEERLDATIAVQNLDGAATAIGTSAGLNAEQNCMTMLFHGIPHLTFSYLTQNVDYSLEDLAPVAGVSIEPGVLRVADDAPWDTFQDLIADARKRPGQIRVSVSLRTSNNYVGMRAIEDAFDVRFNIIAYDGGGPSRNALLSGEVDATHAGVFNSLGLEDATKVLGVQMPENRWGDVTGDAPVLAGPDGEAVPENSSRYSTWVPTACRDDYPKRYEALVGAMREALADPGLAADLAELGEESKLDYLDPDALGAVARDSDEEIRSILEDDPDAFTTSP